MDLKDLLLIENESHYQCIFCYIIDTFVLQIALNRPHSVIALNRTLARTKQQQGQAGKRNGVKPKGRKNFVSVKPNDCKNFSVLNF